VGGRGAPLKLTRSSCKCADARREVGRWRCDRTVVSYLSCRRSSLLIGAPQKGAPFRTMEPESCLFSRQAVWTSFFSKSPYTLNSMAHPHGYLEHHATRQKADNVKASNPTHRHGKVAVLRKSNALVFRNLETWVPKSLYPRESWIPL
jgi:hypothetical protein